MFIRITCIQYNHTLTLIISSLPFTLTLSGFSPLALLNSCRDERTQVGGDRNTAGQTKCHTRNCGQKLGQVRSSSLSIEAKSSRRAAWTRLHGVAISQTPVALRERRRGGGRGGGGQMRPKLQALVYDILPSTTAVFSYVIESRKLSANEQFCLLVLKQ